MAIGFLLGAAQFGAGALQAYGQHQQAQADYDYGVASQTQDYYNRIQQYQYQERERAIAWQERLAVRAWKTAQHQEQVEENFNAMESAWFNNSKLANEYIEKFAGQAFRKEMAFAEAQSASFNTQAGKRSNLRQGVNSIKYGMERMNMVDQLTRNIDKIEYDNEQIRKQTMRDNKNSWYDVSVPMMTPTRGPAPTAPVYQSRPSNMGLYSGLLGAAGTGLNTWDTNTPSGLFGQRSGVPKPG